MQKKKFGGLQFRILSLDRFLILFKKREDRNYMNITIVLPYPEARSQYRIWAHEEEKVDFRHEKDRATRCTVSYAAEELESYLKRMGFEAEVSDGAGKDFNIYLLITKDEQGDVFTYEISEHSLTIDGTGRVGVLYGVYEFLEKQGVYWLNPWEESVPFGLKSLLMPEPGRYQASFPYDRGYSFDGELKESEFIWKWMARKKLNTAPRRPWKPKLQQKLGITFVQGGHVFEEILDPNTVMPSGRTMWEEHEDWFGLPADGGRNRFRAQNTGFCVSNPEVLEYVSEKLIEKLNTEWYEVDTLAIWGFDTWGGTCTCENCRKLGNGSDHTLHLNSYIRDSFDRAFAEGRLDRHININFSMYEGTADIQPPMNPVPENLRNTRDSGSFCPINRCYAHTIDDETCDYNKNYNDWLTGWKDVSVRLNEYYNVSRFEDLPFLYTRTMPHDFRHYVSEGVRGMVYMHLPMLHWDVKNLTQVLYAELCWNVNSDVEQILKEYFEHRYGAHAEAMRNVYELLEEAGTYCQNWRAWSGASILSCLQRWDGARKDSPLHSEIHLGEHAAEEGLKSVELYEKAIAVIEKELAAEESSYIRGLVGLPDVEAAVNPAQQALKAKSGPVSERLHLDLNYVRYGKDCMELITLFVMYYDSLRRNEDTEALFDRIDSLAQKMMGYYIPLRWGNPDIEIYCDDALTRCQLKSLYYRCRAFREKEQEGQKNKN